MTTYFHARTFMAAGLHDKVEV